MGESEIQRIAAKVLAMAAELRSVVDGLGQFVSRLEQHTAEVADMIRGSQRAQCILDPLYVAIAAVHATREYVGNAAENLERWADDKVGGGGSTSATTAGVTPSAQVTSANPEALRWSSTEDRDKLNAPLPPSATIVVDDRFTYETDEDGRVVRAEATLNRVDLDHPREKLAQRRLPGKLPGDHAGHLIARIFGGPGQQINLTPMHGQNVNLGEFATLERNWRQAIEDGKTVEVFLDLEYEGDSRRPDGIGYAYTVDDELVEGWVDNTPSGEDES